MPYFPYPYMAAVAQGQYPQQTYSMPTPQRPAVTPQQSHQQQPVGYQQKNQLGPRNNNERKRVYFDRLPMPYGEILPYLIQKGMVEPRPLPQVAPPYPPYFDENAKCDYHAGSPGHTIENCKAFKYKVQELIDKKLISFKEEGPNVKDNPLPGHAGLSVNAVEEIEEQSLIKKVTKIKASMSVIQEKLIGYNEFEEIHSNCKVCLANPERCQKMRDCLQKLMDQGLVQIGYSRVDADVSVLESQDPTPIEIPYSRRGLQIPGKAVDPIVFHVPTPFPFDSMKKVPWKYQPTAYVGGKPLTNVESNVTNIVGIGSMTRSGRIFSSEQPNKKSLVIPRKGKSVEDEIGDGPSRKTLPQEEAEEFLRIIRKSDYRIVDQLGQTPSKISMLSLLLSSEAHREALLKVLNEAHVTRDITVDQFDGVVGNITASRYLGFSEDELPAEGHNHNRALHISVKCLDNILSRVLVDTGSSLNVMPKTTLLKLAVEGALMRPSSMVVKAFDGSRRTVVGEVDLPILIGPQLFTITFQVMDINPTYSCLLGRPWIHDAGAVTSTLHQKLKFITGDKMIVVSGQEDMMVSHLSSFRYIEADEEAAEVPFQALEIASVMTIKSDHSHHQRRGSAMSSWKAMKEALEEGSLEGWGRLPDIPEKKDRFGLGYQPSTTLFSKDDREGIRTIQEMFCSAGFIHEGHVAMLEDTDEE
ncbi:hypothetical protein TSUD_419170, partial [Trifolium subterraneum]